MIDFSEILKDKFKLPSISNTIDSIRVEESCLINEENPVPVPNPEKSKINRVKLDIAHLLEMKVQQEVERGRSKKLKRDKDRSRRKEFNLIRKLNRNSQEHQESKGESLEKNRGKSESLIRKEKIIKKAKRITF